MPLIQVETGCFATKKPLTDVKRSFLLIMGIFKKKVMYTSLPTDGEDEKSTYFGESSLGNGELSDSRSSKGGLCKVSVCKVAVFLITFMVIFSGM